DDERGDHRQTGNEQAIGARHERYLHHKHVNRARSAILPTLKRRHPVPPSVTAPRLAVETSRIYFASTPRVNFGAGLFHCARRRARTASSTLSCNSSLCASIVIESPSSISAMAPPS